MYDIEFQIKLLANIIKIESLQEQALAILDAHDFSYYICQFIWNVVESYNARVKHTIPLAVLADEISNHLKGLYPAINSTLLPREEEPLADTVMRIYAEDIHKEYYEYILPIFIRHQRSTKILSKLQDPDIDVDTRDHLLHELADIKDLSLSANSGITFISDDPEIMTSDSNEVRIPTGLRLVDTRIIGGLGIGEVGLITACPGVGKTTTLINIAYGAALSGLFPLFITLEVKSKLIKRRLIAMASGIEGRWVNKPYEEWPEREQKLYQETIKSEAVNRIAVCDMSTGRKTGATLRKAIISWIKTIKDRYGADAPAVLVCIDHLDELDPPPESTYNSKNIRRDEMYKEVMADLARLAVELDIGVWVATQGTRDAMGKQILDMQHVSSAFHKNDNITIGIGIAIKKNLDAAETGPDPYAEYEENFSNSGEELVFSINKNRNGQKSYCIVYRGPTLRYWDRLEDALIEQKIISNRTDVSNWHRDLYQISINKR